MWRRAVLCGVVCGVLVGCSDSGRPVPEISSVRQLAGLLRREGLGCRDVHMDDPAEPQTVGVVEAGSCKVVGVADVGLSIFDNRNAVQTLFELAHTTKIPCGFIIGDDRLYTAVGPTWTISFPTSSDSDDEPSRRGARRVSKRLGIELEVIECRNGEPVE